MKIAPIIVALALVSWCAGAPAQGWTPEKNVEIVVPSLRGGSMDHTAALIEKALREYKLNNTTATVVNMLGPRKPYEHVNEHQGDPHYLMIVSLSIHINHLKGLSKFNYENFTPIASLFKNYTVYMVNAGSDIGDGNTLIARLRKDPSSVTFGFSYFSLMPKALGTSQHLASALLMKAIGGKASDLKNTVYKSPSEALEKLASGQFDVLTASAVAGAAMIRSGKSKILAIAAPRRMDGLLADVPTWKELGIDFVHGDWHGVMGPKGISAEHVAYWESVLKKVTETPDWLKQMKSSYWVNDFVPSLQFSKELEKEYSDIKAIYAELGL